MSAGALLCAAVPVGCGGHTAASASTTTAIGHASAAVAPGDWLTFDYDSPIVVGGRIILPTGSYHDSSNTSTIDIFHLRGR